MKRFGVFVSALMLAGFVTACGGTDAGITTKVKTQFAADDTVKAYQIDVTTREGVVTLEGDVDTAAARMQAVQIARSTEGVRDVIDQLRVSDTAATSGVGDGLEQAAKETGEAIERGAEATGGAIKRGAEATADAAKDAGRRVRDAVTDDDRDSDNDGK